MNDVNVANFETRSINLDAVQGRLTAVQQLMKDENLPVDCEANRLGIAVYDGELGQVREKTREKDGIKFYHYWLPDGSNGRCAHKDGAFEKIGLVKPVGCDDFEGKVRLGKVIEQHTIDDYGTKVHCEIRKHVVPAVVALSTYYYAWNGGTEALKTSNLADARRHIGIVVETKVAPKDKLHAARAKKMARAERDRQEYAKKMAGK